MKIKNHAFQNAAAISGAALLGVAAISAASSLSPARGPLLTPAQSENPLSLAGGALTLDIEARLRAEARENSVDFDRTKSDANTDDQWLLTRVRLGATIKPCSEFKVYLQMQDSREIGSKRPNVPGSSGSEGDDLFELRQVWMEFGNALSHPLTLKIGRQTLSYGDERLLGVSDWNNLSRVFDAAKLRWEAKNWSVDLFSASLVDNTDRGQFNQSDFLNGRERNRGEMLNGVYGSTKAFGLQTTDLYVLHLHQEVGGGNTNFYTCGTRVKSNPGAFSSAKADGKKKPVGFDYSGEFAFQTGKLNKLGVVKNLQAFALNAGGGFTFDAPGTPRLGLAYSYATGDKNSADSKWDGFQNLYPTNHKFYGQFDAFSWQNMHDMEVNFKVTPVKNVTIKAELHAFWLATTNDYWYRASTSTLRSVSAAGGAGSYAGSEADLTATWNVTKPVAVEAGYSRFVAGSYLKDTGAHSNADFGYLQLKVTF